nr:capsule biosynthesis protein [Paracoccus aestuariivivens]
MGTPAKGAQTAAVRPFQNSPRLQPVVDASHSVVKAAPANSIAAKTSLEPIPVRPLAQPASAARPLAVRPAAAVPATPRAAEAVRPPVAMAHVRPRHWFILVTFFLMVVLPTAAWAWYLWNRATDQYVSTVGFSVRKEDMTPSIDLLSGLSPLGGGSGASDTDILYEYIRSQDMVEKIDEQLNLRSRFSRDWPHDFVFAFDPDGHVEDLTDYWDRQVKVLYDTTSNLITLKVNAFSAEDAQKIAAAVFKESSDKINDLSAIAREDATRLATAELEKTRKELTTTRQAMTDFRMRSLIVDPHADLESQMGVLAGLQAKLAEALVANDVLLDNAKPTDHRVTQSQQKIDAIRKLIETERSKFGTEGKGPQGESYSQLMAEYEKLMVDREFAEGAYRSARIAYETALAEAQRKSRYLAAHIQPKVAQSSTVPNRPWLLALVAGMLLAGWSILALVYYSIRDRS